MTDADEKNTKNMGFERMLLTKMKHHGTFVTENCAQFTVTNQSMSMKIDSIYERR